ncbi:MAG: hypothetical protein BWZ08_01916 [candidate division BRC1 bacterium ADurb.BinA292]|nr:MAG: hypothetical protein BWZ08_01916 [candidate division BRC1 bacterium ADurb.BinA292]
MAELLVHFEQFFPLRDGAGRELRAVYMVQHDVRRPRLLRIEQERRDPRPLFILRDSVGHAPRVGKSIVGPQVIVPALAAVAGVLHQVAEIIHPVEPVAFRVERINRHLHAVAELIRPVAPRPVGPAHILVVVLRPHDHRVGHRRMVVDPVDLRAVEPRVAFDPGVAPVGAHEAPAVGADVDRIGARPEGDRVVVGMDGGQPRVVLRIPIGHRGPALPAVGAAVAAQVRAQIDPVGIGRTDRDAVVIIHLFRRAGACLGQFRPVLPAVGRGPDPLDRTVGAGHQGVEAVGIGRIAGKLGAASPGAIGRRDRRIERQTPVGRCVKHDFRRSPRPAPGRDRDPRTVRRINRNRHRHLVDPLDPRLPPVGRAEQTAAGLVVPAPRRRQDRVGVDQFDVADERHHPVARPRQQRPVLAPVRRLVDPRPERVHAVLVTFVALAQADVQRAGLDRIHRDAADAQRRHLAVGQVVPVQPLVRGLPQPAAGRRGIEDLFVQRIDHQIGDPAVGRRIHLAAGAQIRPRGADVLRSPLVVFPGVIQRLLPVGDRHHPRLVDPVVVKPQPGQIRLALALVIGALAARLPRFERKARHQRTITRRGVDRGRFAPPRQGLAAQHAYQHGERQHDERDGFHGRRVILGRAEHGTPARRGGENG